MNEKFEKVVNKVKPVVKGAADIIVTLALIIAVCAVIDAGTKIASEKIQDAFNGDSNESETE